MYVPHVHHFSSKNIYTKCVAFSRGVLNRNKKLFVLFSGLCLTKDGNLLTLDVDKRNPKIVIFSQKGELMNFFPYSPLQGRVPQSKCRFLGVNQNNLVVSDLGKIH